MYEPFGAAQKIARVLQAINNSCVSTSTQQQNGRPWIGKGRQCRCLWPKKDNQLLGNCDSVRPPLTEASLLVRGWNRWQTTADRRFAGCWLEPSALGARGIDWALCYVTWYIYIAWEQELYGKSQKHTKRRRPLGRVLKALTTGSIVCGFAPLFRVISSHPPPAHLPLVFRWCTQCLLLPIVRWDKTRKCCVLQVRALQNPWQQNAIFLSLDHFLTAHNKVFYSILNPEIETLMPRQVRGQ